MYRGTETIRRPDTYYDEQVVISAYARPEPWTEEQWTEEQIYRPPEPINQPSDTAFRAPDGDTAYQSPLGN